MLIFCISTMEGGGRDASPPPVFWNAPLVLKGAEGSLRVAPSLLPLLTVTLT